MPSPVSSMASISPPLLFLPTAPNTYEIRTRRWRINCADKSTLEEIRVCTNRTCRRQGSAQTLETFSGLAPPEVVVKPCGCLGRCGSGPNLVSLPQAVVVSHCATAARAAEVIFRLCGRQATGADVDDSLTALALRKRALSDIEMANFAEANLLLTQAIDMNPFGGLHIMYKDRSVARLALGNHSGALEDAEKALKLSPRYSEAYICQGDVFLETGQYDLAEKSFLTCLEIDPSIRRTKSFKARVENLNKKLLNMVRIDAT